MSTLDDIFGSSPPAPSHHHPNPNASHPTEPSDLPSLRRQHVTAGYRDGIEASKSTHVQSGFDAGFPVGAQLGMRAGTILGILEGVLRGYDSQSVIKKQLPGRKPPTTTTSTDTNGAVGIDEAEKRAAKRAHILALYQQAITELDVRKVFEGISEGELTSSEEKVEGRLGRQGEGVVGKWEGRVSVPRWEENMEALEMKEVIEGAEGDGEGR
ncbi:hypothetical protein BO94DRAFT_300678 [Aspergillus sclerotioniger CBS 115572]|uniref:Protein YAE1 n=1 Tax=Aspergillus sclerotioniger CBS 115572 TaxID=1450535 RepID=A0A317V2H8_9EURO|nr:hypothetical protein BO94DRAFT_300678 [Aspergillus sclerotioniger CBS 115572]PWY68494.1 hypothetical protein BO94DRAFT_300678 [Aspergillus sclerotioniger CBS 115572]